MGRSTRFARKDPGSVKRLLLMLCSAAALAAPRDRAARAGRHLHMAMDTSKSTDGWT
jgi:hypothetical protein